MTYAEREAIFSKEYISIQDLGTLLGLNYQMAAKRMRDIKRRSDRLRIQGKIHVQDYLEYFALPPDRYRRPSDEMEDRSIASVCDYAGTRRYR